MQKNEFYLENQGTHASPFLYVISENTANAIIMKLLHLFSNSVCEILLLKIFVFVPVTLPWIHVFK